MECHKGFFSRCSLGFAGISLKTSTAMVGGWVTLSTWFLLADRTPVMMQSLPGSSVMFQLLSCIDWFVPPPSKSHHQDYYIFSRESL